MSVPNPKLAICISQITVSNAGTVTGRIDTLGYDYLNLAVVMGTTNAATNNPTVFKIGEGDTTSTYTDIAALTGDGATGWTIPSMSDATTTENAFLFNIDLRGRKRYLLLTISPLTTHLVTAMGQLYRAEQLPITTTSAGVLALVNA